jgi:hypothetical protein
MQYRPLNDLIDPDVDPDDGEADPTEGESQDRDAGYVIGEDGRAVVNLELSEALARRTGRRRPSPKVKILAAALGAVCIALTVWNLARLSTGSAAPPQPTPFQVKQALYLGALKLEAYRKVHGTVPTTLDEAGVPEQAGYAYRAVDTRHYVLSFVVAGSKAEYDSSVPLERAFGSPREMLAMRGAP